MGYTDDKNFNINFRQIDGDCANNQRLPDSTWQKEVEIQLQKHSESISLITKELLKIKNESEH
tara:strand:+ start:652 stop:840 length:189 start_codon:yes stop_codon:yes gene_type:complete